MRRVAELHWPTLLVASACTGLALSIWISVPLALATGGALAGLGVALSVDDLDAVPGIGPTRIEQLRDLVTP